MNADLHARLRQLTDNHAAFQQQVAAAIQAARDEDFVGTALDGGVTVTVSGFGALRSIEIGTMTKRGHDNATLGDAVVDAVHRAEANARSAVRDRISAVLHESGIADLVDAERLQRLF